MANPDGDAVIQVARRPSLTAREAPDVPEPIAHRLSMEEVYANRSYPNPDIIRKHFAGEGRLEEDVAVRIVKEAADIFRKEPNMLEIQQPLTICGDIHGQYYDLLSLLRPNVGGDVSSTKYLFLGDYVDRGYFGAECVLLLFSLKINHPDTFFMLRGNHECRHLTAYFTFKRECLIKYSESFYEACMEAFDCLPLAALMNRQFLCIHGGISPELDSLRDLAKINRFKEPETYGPMCDLLWADPSEDFGEEQEDEFFLHNTTRGCSYFFTYKAVSAFLKRNKLLGLIRAHEVQSSGYRMYKGGETTKFPVLITVFSAPNYLDVYKNKAAILLYRDNLINIRQFKEAPHPYWLPNFMDVFTWSYPFVAEKVTDILVSLLNICSEEELGDEDEAVGLAARKQIIKNKIWAVAKVRRQFAQLREHSETALHLQGLTPVHGEVPTQVREDLAERLSGRTLAERLSGKTTENGGEHLEGGLLFHEIKSLDKINERLPDVSRLSLSEKLSDDPNAAEKKREEELVTIISTNVTSAGM